MEMMMDARGEKRFEGLRQTYFFAFFRNAKMDHDFCKKLLIHLGGGL